MDYIYLLLGLGLLLAGANYLVDSSVAIAQRAKISNFIIGLTIVGMGTSSPELFVSISSALHNDGDVAMGNVIGSNICNIFLILGATAAICPFAIDSTTQWRHIPVSIFAAVLVLFAANDYIIPGLTGTTIGRHEGIFFLVCFALYMLWVITRKAKDPQKALEEADEQTKSQLAGANIFLLWGIAAVSLAALIGGGQLFLDSAKSLAHTWGMSDAVISITIVAIGTSLPELITAIVAALKKNPQLALGNVIGSTIFNLWLILGVAATVKPLTLVTIRIEDYLIMVLATILTFVVVYTFKKKTFDRIEGIIFLVIYVAYTVFLLLRQ